MVKPIVAVTGPQKGAAGPRLCVALGIRWAGGMPVQIRPEDDITTDYQAVVVTGGHDIDPVLYAAEPEVEPRYDAQRDQFESDVIDDALARDLPMLGICRGAQLMNVRLGGTLVQDLNAHRQHTSKRRTPLPLKSLIIEHDSRYLSYMGAGVRRINSLHNQAIDRLGKGLNVAGRDLDDIVQAVEDRSARFRLGVQWHPEFLLYMPVQRQLFRRLVSCISE